MCDTQWTGSVYSWPLKSRVATLLHLPKFTEAPSQTTPINLLCKPFTTTRGIALAIAPTLHQHVRALNLRSQQDIYWGSPSFTYLKTRYAQLDRSRKQWHLPWVVLYSLWKWNKQNNTCIKPVVNFAKQLTVFRLSTLNFNSMSELWCDLMLHVRGWNNEIYIVPMIFNLFSPGSKQVFFFLFLNENQTYD